MIQHYRFTLNDAIKHYQLKLISATALLYYYIRIKRAEGWKITLYQKQTCKELGIKKSTFYKAISKLLQKGLISTDDANGVSITVINPQSVESSPQSVESSPQSVESSPQSVESSPQSVESSPQSVESSLQSVDSSLQSVDSSLQSVELSPQSVENESLKHTQRADHSVSTNLYQIFNNSLSLRERESFEKFCRKKADELPKPPILFTRWLERNWEDLRNEWYKHTGKAPCEAVQRWENHPLKEEWLTELEEFQNPGQFYMPNDVLDEDRRDFYAWAYENKILSWRKDK